MARAAALAAVLAAALAACGPPRPTVTPSPGAPPGPPLATLLAHPGTRAVFVVAGDRHHVVAGRNRYRLDDDGGATRLRVSTARPSGSAVGVPAFLGGGVLLLGADELFWAHDTRVVSLLRGAAIAAPSFGTSPAVLARLRTGGGEWVSIPLSDKPAPATWIAPPLDAPLLPVPMATSNDSRPPTAGPDFASPSLGVALVAILGPVVTTDGGQTFTALGSTAPFWPTRVTRDGHGSLVLADGGQSGAVTSGGGLGPLTPIPPKPPSPPRVASLSLEQILPDGVALDDAHVLVAEGDRLATVQRDPLRVLSTTDTGMTSCLGMRKTTGGPGIAVGVWKRHHDTFGEQLVIGHVVAEAAGPRLVIERVFPNGVDVRFSSTGAVVIAASCAGQSTDGNLQTTERICVRSAAGVFRDTSLQGLVIGDRAATLPDAEGGLTFLCRPPGASMRLVDDHGRAVATLPPNVGDLRAADTLADRWLLWTTKGSTISSLSIDRKTRALTVRSHVLPEGSSFGIAGNRLLIARSVESVIMGEVSRDAGASFEPIVWPSTAPRLAGAPAVECGALGCRLFGWTRLGWEANVGSADQIVAADEAPTLPKPPDAPRRARGLRATCTSLGPEVAMDPASVPTVGVGYSAREALLGLPEPKVPKGQTVALMPFVRGSVRGGFISTGPSHPQPFGDSGRTVARFSTDLDPIGVRHETLASPTPFADANAASLQGLQGYALAPGRVLAAVCGWYGCSVHRLVAGMPLEALPQPPGLVLRSVLNAREIGGALLVVGQVSPEKLGGFAYAWEQTGFAGIYASGSWSVLTFALGEETVATTDIGRGRFGLFVASKVPAARGGSSFVLALDGLARPTTSFETLVGSDPDLVRASQPCAATVAAWDRGDTMTRSRPLELVVDGVQEGTPLLGEAGVLRTRLGPKGGCLERLTVLHPTGAFQWDALTGRAIRMRLASTSKTIVGERRSLTCTLAFRD